MRKLLKEDFKKVQWAHQRLKLSLLAREHRGLGYQRYTNSLRIDFDVKKEAAPGDITKTMTHTYTCELHVDGNKLEREAHVWGHAASSQPVNTH